MRRLGGNRRTIKSVATATACLLLFAGGAFAFNSIKGEQSAKRKSRAAASFVVRGSLDRRLAPGVTSRVTISIANNRKIPIWVKRLRFRMSVDRAHAKAGCSIKRDFRIAQLTRRTFPIRIPAKRKVKVRRGKINAKSFRWRALAKRKTKGRPYVTMRNLAGVNQDACKGATFKLKFKGKATTKRPKKRKRVRR